MKTSFFLFILTSGFCYGQETPKADKFQQQFEARQKAKLTVQMPLSSEASPCSDSLYLALKAIPLNKQSDREYQYFLAKDKDCVAYTTSNMQEKQKKERVKKAINAYVAIALIGILVPFIIILSATQP